VRIWSFAESRVESVLTGTFFENYVYSRVNYLPRITGHGWDVKCVEWHPTKGLLVSGSKDNQIKFWDPRTGAALSTLYAILHFPISISTNFMSRHQHKNTIQVLSWSPNGNLVASASRNQTIRVFDIRAMKEFRVLKGHKKEVCCTINHSLMVYT
jgi:polyadenylation factor subunit 2